MLPPGGLEMIANPAPVPAPPLTPGFEIEYYMPQTDLMNSEQNDWCYQYENEELTLIRVELLTLVKVLEWSCDVCAGDGESEHVHAACCYSPGASTRFTGNNEGSLQRRKK